jgi:hypothetical protein
MTSDRSFQAAKLLPNEMDIAYPIEFLKEYVGSYFWRPPRFSDSMRIMKVHRWYVPIWRLRGEASASWIEIIRTQKTVEQGEQKITVPEVSEASRYREFDIDWVGCAFIPNSEELNEIYRAINESNRNKLSISVDWQGNIWGRLFEEAFYLPGGVVGAIKNWLRSSFRPYVLGAAERIFMMPSNELSNARNIRSYKFRELPPEVPLAEAKDQIERMAQNRIRKMIYSLSKERKDLDASVVFHFEEQYVIPVWFVLYQYMDHMYSAIFNGNNCQPIKIHLPDSLRAGLIAWGLATLTFCLPLSLIVGLFAILSKLGSTSYSIISIWPFALIVFMPIIITTIPILPWLINKLFFAD